MSPRHVSIETEEADTGAQENLVIYKKRCRYQNTKLFSLFDRIIVQLHVTLALTYGIISCSFSLNVFLSGDYDKHKIKHFHTCLVFLVQINVFT